MTTILPLEHFGSVRPPPDRDQSADARGRAVRRARVRGAAGQRSAVDRFSDAERRRRPARRRSRDAGIEHRQPAGAPVHGDRRPRFDDLVERARHHQRHPPVRSRPQHRRRRRRRPDRDCRGAAAAAARHAQRPDLPQGQSRRPADLRRRPELRHPSAVGNRRLRADPDRAADRGAQRRRPGQRARRPEVRGPRPGRSRSAARPGHRHQRDRSAAAELQREPADRPAVRAHRHVHHPRQRPADDRGRLPADDPRLPQPRAGPPRAGGDRDRQRRGQPQRVVAVRSGSRAPRHPGLGAEAARQQHPRGDRLDQGPAAADQQPAAAGHSPDSGHRSRAVDSRRVQGHQDHDGRDPGAGRLRDLPVPAECVGHAHSGAGAAVLDPGHLRGDAADALQPQQHVADGADPVVRLRGRRRDRDAGEHRAPSRGGRRSLARDHGWLARSRLHDSQHDGVAGGGVHPGAVSRRHPRPAVSRIRGHDYRGGGDLRAGLGVADADALQPAAQGPAQGRQRAVGRSGVRCIPPSVQPQPHLRAAAPVRRAGAVLRGARRDHADVPRGAQGIHPRPGRRLDQHRAARGARHRLRGDVRERPAGREPGALEPQPAARRRLSRQRSGRRRRHEYGPRRDAHEAARRPRQHRAGNRRADAAAARALSRVPHLRDAAAGAADRRPAGRQQLQRHAAQPRHHAAVRLGRQVSGGDCAAAARAGRVERSGNQEPARPAGDRSRQGRRGGARSRRDLGRVVQRLRAEMVVDHLR